MTLDVEYVDFSPTSSTLCSITSSSKQQVPNRCSRAGTAGWEIVEPDGIKRLRRVFSVDDFGQAMEFTKKLLADAPLELKVSA